MNKLSILAVILSVVAIVIAGIAITNPAVIERVGNATADFWDAAYYKVAGTTVIDSSRAFSGTTGTFTTSATIGSGTAITKVLCAATTTNWAAFAGNNCQSGTTSMSGLTYSLDGGWGFTVNPVATSSGIETVNSPFFITAYASSTDTVYLRVCIASSTLNTNLPAQRYEICAFQH